MIIYELGAGNGTLMKGILDYLSSSEPEIYARTEYKIIEISPRLAELQKARAGEHAAKVKVVQSDIFDWTATETRSCFFLAFEVLDNLAHDLIRFTRDAEEPKALQCNISVASTGEFNEQYTLVTDPLISSLLTLLPPLIPTYPAFVRKFLASLPFAPNLTQPIYLPTKVSLSSPPGSFTDLLATVATLSPAHPSQPFPKPPRPLLRFLFFTRRYTRSKRPGSPDEV